jgi:hypothetical protein
VIEILWAFDIGRRPSPSKLLVWETPRQDNQRNLKEKTMNNGNIQTLIGATCFLMGVALIPTLLRSISILASESRWGFAIWATSAVAFTVWQWKFTEIMIELFKRTKRVMSHLIERLRR